MKGKISLAICSLLLLFRFPLLAEMGENSALLPPLTHKAPLEIESEFVNYQGQDVILTGKVTLTHGLGKIYCREAQFSKELLANERPFPCVIQLKKEVQFHLKGGGILFCHEAQFNLGQLTIDFMGLGPEKAITFEQKEGKEKISLKGEKAFASFYSNRQPVKLAELDSAKEEGDPFQLELLRLEGQVVLHYGDPYQWQAQADVANYRPLPAGEGGEVELLPQERFKRQSLCQVKDNRGAFIQAQRILCQAKESLNLFFTAPQGELIIPQDKENFDKSLAPLTFSAGSLIWNDQEKRLTLDKQVSLTHPPFGMIDAEETIHIQLADLAAGHHCISSLTAYGPINFTYIDPWSKELHYLNCSGEAALYPALNQVKLKGDPTQEGALKQVVLQDRYGMIFADELKLDYGCGFYKSLKAHLQGNVYMINYHMPQQGARYGLPQCALADQLEYSLQEAQMLLMADSGQRVLFFDEANNIQISAPLVRLWRDRLSGKAAVQGEGDVRCTFNPLELEAWKNIKFRYQKIAYPNLSSQGKHGG